MTAQDMVQLEIFANLFRAIVDEMAWVVLRSSHTTFIKETQDFGVALVTQDGEMFAYPYGTGASSMMGTPLHAATRATADWARGDVLISNDPYATRGMVMHLNDLYMVKPIFIDGALLCFAWAFIHCTDVGGSAPGSIDMTNFEVFQEGIRIRPVKLFKAGHLNQEVWDLIADNCRIPTLNWGDVTACVASLAKAEERIERLARRFGRAELERAMVGTLDRTERLARLTLAQIPAGSTEFTEYFEDDYVTDIPVQLHLKLTSDGAGGIALDYAGSDPQVRSALNMPTGSQRHHPFLSLALINFVMTRAAGIHLNAGILRAITLVLPDASVVNASFPAACGLRFTTAMRTHDLILGALNAALPGQVPAGGSSAYVITYVATTRLGGGSRVVVANPVPGGSGGGPDRDGISGTDYPVQFFRNVPVEILETEAPVLVRRFGLLADSEGAGRFRGGFGLEYELQVLHHDTTVVTRGKDRHRLSSWGAHGGGSGGNYGNTGRRADGTTRAFGKTTILRPERGETVRLWSGGGGGFGDPLDRPVAAVLADVQAGLVSPARATAVYGLIFAAPSEVDSTATARNRAAAQRSAGTLDFGPARTAWEYLHGLAAARIAAWLPAVPASLRRHAQTATYRILHAAGPGPYDSDAVGLAIAAVRAELQLSDS